MAPRRVVPALAGAAVAAAAAAAFLALRDPPGPGAGDPAPAARPRSSLSPLRREAEDILDAVRRGRYSSALSGIASLLARHDPADLDGDLAGPFAAARLEAGRWGLSEAPVLAEGGEAAGALDLLRRSAAALAGTPGEGEVAAAEERVRGILDRRRAEEEARAAREAREPADRAVASAREAAGKGGTAKALESLRAALRATTDPAARKVLEGEVAALAARLAGERTRAGRRKAADAALAKGEYGKAREILSGLAAEPGEGEAAKAEAARDAERAEAVKDLEENREPEALAAVRKALRWLVKQQLPDGSFSVSLVDASGRKPTEEERKRARHRTGITGLCALALLGHVRHDVTDEFAAPLDRALAWILAARQKDGSFSRNLYEHSLCTLALVDADRLVRRSGVREAAQGGIAYLQDAANLDGGWRYTAKSPPSDVSVTGWALQALLHARLGAYEVNPQTVDLAFAYLDRMTDPLSGKTGYLVVGGGSLAMTAATLFCRLRNGMGPSDEAVAKAADLLLRTPPKPGWSETSYHLYYASDAMSRMGGKWWKAWAPALKKHLLSTQVAKGDDEGAWPTAGDRWAQDAGAVYLAAIHALCLENFFEHRE